MTRGERPPGQLREQSHELCAGPERWPEERTISRGMTFEIQASCNTEDRRQSWEEAITLPFPVRGLHRTRHLGGGRRGPFWFWNYNPLAARYLEAGFTECVTLIIILRGAFGTRKFDEFMRSAAIFLRRL